ncbi:MarR family transcriptional regulator [Streptomyces sp. SKN60]|uniref:MarR family transcriptional regulator n=1 Tax=Streptomyces sp. SKN60 TaxID=2855506 RepID=UPI0022468BE9|nr:MarR family transcriptional regulator [Streptomyces sp. SKN60]MCX2182726.1 MarR family transcriptional regulator [Streptomyces sp. SKN60]
MFHLRQGQVFAVETPGAPTAEALLLRSGRVSAADWATVSPTGTLVPAEELVTRGHIGAAELQVVTVMALRDAVFAVVAGETAECVAVPPRSAPTTPAARGDDPLKLLDEAARKVAGLAALPQAVLPDRERVVAGAGVVGPAEHLARQRREILFHANGRRTARDIAFTVGRGVYHVTVEISRMLGEGLLERAGRGEVLGTTESRSVPALEPRRGAHGAGTAGADADLPYRTPGASGFTMKSRLG